MEKPFQLIEGKLTRREEFDVTEGRQPTYALLYLKEGSYRLRIGDTETVLREGDCAIFTDDIDFSRSVITPISFVYLKFRVNPKCPFSLPFPSGKVAFRNRKRFLDSIRAYEGVMDSVDARSLYYKEHLLEDILFQIHGESHPGADADRAESPADSTQCHDVTVRRAVAYIRANLEKKLSVADIFHGAETNSSTLNFKFRRELGKSVGAFVTDERIRLGRRLLAGTTFTVGEIAARCGYDNIYYFSTSFRKNTGCSPTAFREQYR